MNMIKYLSKTQWIFKVALKIIANRLVWHPTQLTPEYLINKGWVESDGYYVEVGIKDRDLISISFENHYYRVWHSKARTFIALESSLEWFETYYLIMHGDNGRYDLSGI